MCPSLFAGFWLKLRQEARLLIRHFPAEHPAHRERVKALIPFILERLSARERRSQRGG